MTRRLALLALLITTGCKSAETTTTKGAPSSSAPPSPVASMARPAGPCGEFQALVASTYNFRPATLEGEARKQKTAQLDDFDRQVRAHKEAWLPCLRTALKNPASDGYFRFDGSDLLLRLDSSDEAKAIRLQALHDVDLADIQLRSWVDSLAQLGHAGLDTSAAASRWFTLPNPTYPMPEHSMVAGPSVGTTVMFGSMDEARAVPALAAAARQPKFPWVSKVAVTMLSALGTPESWAELQRLSTEKNEAGPLAAAEVKTLRSADSHIKPRTPTKLTRERFTRAGNDLLAGKGDDLDAIFREAPDAEKDIVAVVKADDRDLVRKLRRFVASRDTKRGVEMYGVLTAILHSMPGAPR